ncbi:hypothetical protein B0H14DRAFT_3467487 [Mycena olivaceomarginata]|nr:hypothetical protein B0H14DRAFT_3467487 [Mycena olivaceomarginata]
MPTIRAAALEREIDDLLTNRKHYLKRAGWTYLLERQGPKGRVEVKIGKADDVHKCLPAYTKCGGIRAVCACGAHGLDVILVVGAVGAITKNGSGFRGREG